MITIDRGTANSFRPRQMEFGRSRLDYNLYLDAAGTTIWGDGTGGTSVYMNQNPPQDANVDVTIYGRIPALQRSVRVGAYSDTLTVQIQF